MSSASEIISQMLNSSSFQNELNRIQNEAIDELKQSIQDNFYATYEPKEYERTHQFLNSVQGEISISSTGIEINIFLNPALMEHFSVVDGLNSYVPPLLYYGHQQQGYDVVDYFHNYPGRTEWFDEAFEKIKNNVVSQVKGVIITAMKPTNYR